MCYIFAPVSFHYHEIMYSSNWLLPIISDQIVFLVVLWCSNVMKSLGNINIFWVITNNTLGQICVLNLHPQKVLLIYQNMYQY